VDAVGSSPTTGTKFYKGKAMTNLVYEYGYAPKNFKFEGWDEFLGYTRYRKTGGPPQAQVISPSSEGKWSDEKKWNDTDHWGRG
jgi:hypothetical protein